MSQSFAACSSCLSVNRYDTARADTATCGRCKAALPVHGPITDLAAKTLASLTAKCPVPVVVDFWAPWCGPCVAFAPTFEAVAEKLAGRVVFAKANTENHPDVAATHGIRGIPTLIVFHKGREIARQSGAMGAQAFADWLQQTTGAAS